MSVIIHHSGKITNSAGVNLTPTPMVDHWRLSADTTDGAETTVTGWTQISTSNHFPGRIGNSMAVSSGVFTFPDTGIYSIFGSFCFAVGSTNDTICQVWLRLTYDGGSNYNTVSTAKYGSEDDTTRSTCSQTYVLDVTDTSLIKFKYETDSFSANTDLQGNSDIGETNVTIIRLGDT